MNSETAVDPIVAFYSGGVDHRRRTLGQILQWSDDDLEGVHDYIQWLFPTVQPSGVNPSAPLVTERTIRMFAERAELRDRLRAALERMLAFYGLRRVDASGSARIEIDDSRFRERSPLWLRPGNHNHLRLTRMMQSLATLGLREEAMALQRCLTDDICEGPGKNRVSQDTYQYWAGAVPK